MIDLIHLAKEAPGTIIAIPVESLIEANIRLVEKAIADLESEADRKHNATFMTREMVLEKLNVSPATLWRWQKRGYLCPVNVGGQRRYRSTDIDEIMEGKK